jgi:uncharacterized membrane protein YhaH (DUF805 family)
MDAIAEMFSLEGRANRAWYFWHTILDDVVIVTALILFVVVGVATHPLLAVPLLGLVGAAGWAAAAVTVKRLHDIGRPGWHLVLLAVPLYNLYLGAVLVFQKSVTGPNEYGADPLQAVAHSRTIPA